MTMKNKFYTIHFDCDFCNKPTIKKYGFHGFKKWLSNRHHFCSRLCMNRFFARENGKRKREQRITLNLVCFQCKNKFTKIVGPRAYLTIKNSKRVFCSKKCSNEFMHSRFIKRTRMKFKCQHCGDDFYRDLTLNEFRVANNKGNAFKYCSQKCHAIANCKIMCEAVKAKEYTPRTIHFVIWHNCIYCKKKFPRIYTLWSFLRSFLNEKGKFCSQKCGASFQAEKNALIFRSKIEDTVNDVVKQVYKGIYFRNYVTHLKNCNRQFNLDFFFPVFKGSIEVNGNYYHGNPEFFKELDERQKCTRNRDYLLKEVLDKNGIKLLTIWENEIHSGEFKDKVLNFLNV